MTDKSQLVVRVPRDLLDEIRSTFERQGVAECKIHFKDRLEVISAKGRNGETIRVSTYRDGGFRERTVSHCERLTPTQRRKEARRMYRDGLTQIQIAERLGCSQKTISNDVKGMHR